LLNTPTAIITGASRGLGAVFAKSLAKTGYRLVLIARSLDDLKTQIKDYPDPKDHLALKADLLEPACLEEVIPKALDFLGPLSLVFHAAGGGLGFSNPFLTNEEFTKLFQLNLGSVAEINRLVIPTLKEQHSGNLVHVGSIASYEATGSVGYNTTKSALSSYVRTIGRELAPHGIIATGILPGGFISPGNAMDRLKARNPEGYQNFIKERLPRGKMGTAEELIPILKFLSSKEAAMMSGCMVPIDGGEGKSFFAR